MNSQISTIVSIPFDLKDHCYQKIAGSPTMAAFAESTIRKIIFPYLEDSDFEDPDRPSHWLSNITPQALGIDHRSVSSPRRRRRQRDVSDSLDVPWSSSLYMSQSVHGHREDDSSDTDDHDGSFIAGRSAQSISVKHRAKVMSDDQHHRDEPINSSHSGQQGATSPSRPPYSSQNRRRTSVTPLPTSSKRRPQNNESSVNKAKSTPKASIGSERLKSRRHQRHHSLPTPLTPAQPLGQVNTFLPLRLPPPDLRAKSPLANPVGCDFPEHPEEKSSMAKFSAGSTDDAEASFPHHRRAHTSRLASPLVAQSSADDGWDNVQSSPDSSETSNHSVESDGSFHGDAGDADPESQLAAGIARMKAAKRERQDEEARAAKEDRGTTRVKASPTFDDDSVTMQQIQQHAGLLTSLADLVLELKINRSGQAFRHRSSSCADVSSLNAEPHTGTKAALNRTQSADALEGLWSQARRPSSNCYFSSGVSTPYELRDEVARWSRRRNTPGSPRSPSGAATHASRSGLLSYLPFASALRTRLSQLQSIVTIAEAENEDSSTGAGATDDNEGEEQLVDQEYADTLAFSAAASCTKQVSTQMEPSQEQDDDQGELSYSSTNEDDALSSLWASPVASRVSSHYNLRLLSDESCAFEEPGTSIGSGPRPLLRLTQLNGSHHASKPMRNKRGASSASTVSPLWDQKQADEVDPTAESSLSSSAYTRSWSSILGMAA
ncbi:unnamed protein product [Sympodiomycopsis kandeliae]